MQHTRAVACACAKLACNNTNNIKKQANKQPNKTYIE